jgi:hypothetical protein
MGFLSHEAIPKRLDHVIWPSLLLCADVYPCPQNLLFKGLFVDFLLENNFRKTLCSHLCTYSVQCLKHRGCSNIFCWVYEWVMLTKIWLKDKLHKFEAISEWIQQLSFLTHSFPPYSKTSFHTSNFWNSEASPYLFMILKTTTFTMSSHETLFLSFQIQPKLEYNTPQGNHNFSLLLPQRFSQRSLSVSSWLATIIFKCLSLECSELWFLIPSPIFKTGVIYTL